MSVKIIAEVGSTHMGKLDRIKEAIDKALELNINAVKLQLFPNSAPYVPGNVWLDPRIFLEAFAYGKRMGMPVSASVFDETSFKFLLDLKPSFIKFSYGKKEQADQINQTIKAGIEAVVSCDVMSDHLVPDEATKLYCIPEYPVRYKVDFDDLFGSQSLFFKKTEGRFDGFSDHTLGLRQTKLAIKAGAKVIEKHVRLGYTDETCPDARFAVNIEELERLKR